MKKILVGSQNQAKLDAVKEIMGDYPHLSTASIEGVNTSSDVSDQPLSIEETVQGAMNRARKVFNDCDYGIGLESGLMKVPGTKSGYMDVCVCAIYDGQEFHIGLSSAWEFPDPSIFNTMISDKIDMTQAITRAGLTDNTNIGAENGAIGMVTRDRLDRKTYTKQALRTALIHLDQHDIVKTK